MLQGDQIQLSVADFDQRTCAAPLGSDHRAFVRFRSKYSRSEPRSEQRSKVQFLDVEKSLTLFYTPKCYPLSFVFVVLLYLSDPDSRFWILDFRFSILDSRFSTLDSRFFDFAHFRAPLSRLSSQLWYSYLSFTKPMFFRQMKRKAAPGRCALAEFRTGTQWVPISAGPTIFLAAEITTHEPRNRLVRVVSGGSKNKSKSVQQVKNNVFQNWKITISKYF